MHKVSGFYGCWIRCLYIVNDRYFHFTVYQPYSQARSLTNQIAIAVTQTSSLSADCLLEGRVPDGSAVTKGKIYLTNLTESSAVGLHLHIYSNFSDLLSLRHFLLGCYCRLPFDLCRFSMVYLELCHEGAPTEEVCV